MVNAYFLDLYRHVKEGSETKFKWKLPDRLLENKDKILNKFLPLDILNEYQIWHDCGKPFCRILDEEGKQHFPDHAKVSEEIWKQVGTQEAAKLMGMDMLIHTIKGEEIDKFIQYPESISLILTGLAEIHANAEMFSGIESTGFKIKFKQIDKIFKRWLNYVT